MTSIITLVQSDRVHLFTDATAYEQDGTIVMIGPKAFAAPHLPAAIAIRGPVSARPLLGEIISNAAVSFDDLRINISSLLQRAATEYAQLFEICIAGPDFEVVVAGISECDGPSAYLVPSHIRYGSGQFDVIPIAGFTAIPNTSAISAAMSPLMPASGNADDIDAVATGIAVMQIQRANPDTGDAHCRVGGFVQQTTVTSDDIPTRVVHRWPDRVGASFAAG